MVNSPSASPSCRRLSPEKRGGLLSDLIPPIRPDNVDHPFANALQDVAAHQLRQDAWKDVGNLTLTGLGVGAGGAGLVGLVRSLKRNLRPKPHRNPSYLPLPLPVEGEKEKEAAVTTKAGLPWYGPAMFFGGLGGLALGWKGVDGLLRRRAHKERDQELDAARQEFHNALLSQYDKPLAADTPGLQPPKAAADRENCPHCGAGMERGDDGRCNRCGKAWPAKTAADAELGRALDRLYDNVQAALEKRATLDDVLGATAGGYGIYAGLTGLMTGALVYNKMKSRSREAILQKALKKRERRRFAMQPSEIYAMPEAVPHAPAAPGEEG